MKKIIISSLLALTFSATAVSQNKPNILILMAEDMSSRVGAFGDSVAITPNLDALAKQGVRYDNVFTTAGVCAPSRAAHILGMHQITTATQHMRTTSRPDGGYFSTPPKGVKGYPELLRGAGYYTFTDEKLDYQFSGVRANSGPFSIWNDEGTTTWHGRKKDQPFFGLINFQVTHETGIFTPLGNMPHSRMHLLFQILRWWKIGSVDNSLIKPESVKVEPYYQDTMTVRQDIARHYNNISHMDFEVGEILKQLEDEGLAESTIVIWTTDHGDGLPRAKRELYDSGIKVPMIIRWPDAYRPADIKPGQVDQRLISFVDLAPTILNLAGIAPPNYIQGVDFSSSMQRDYIYASRDRIDEVSDRQRAVRDDRFKYIRSWHPELAGGHPLKFRDNIEMMREMRFLYEAGKLNKSQQLWFSAPGKERLFDTKVDPYELVDLSTNPAYKKDLIRMRNVLDHWLESVTDWSDISEASMIKQFYPNGKREKTPTPIATIIKGKLVVEIDGDRSSVGYRINGGNWVIYNKPITLASGTKVEIKAVRYGWEESEITEFSTDNN
ncbi:MAG: arylsulfatase A-like enzyme [Porticoccus sp.]